MTADNGPALSALIRSYSEQISYWKAQAAAGKVSEIVANKEIDYLENLSDRAAFKLGTLKKQKERPQL